MADQPSADAGGGIFRLVASNCQIPRYRLYRGVSLDKMSESEILDLLQLDGDADQKLRSVIDIRTKEEIGVGDAYPLPEGVAYRVLQLTASGDFAVVRNEPAGEKVQVTFYRIDFYTLKKKLKIFTGLFWNNWRLAMSGWRSDRFNTSRGLKMAILMKLTSDVANSKGPVGLYMDWLEPSMDCSSLLALFKLLGRSEIYPAMLHCQYGKDRTGVTCALLQLMNPRMTEEQVVQEYCDTEKQIARFIPELEARVKKANLPAECAHCPREVITEVIAWIRDRYGTVEHYLQQIGLQEFELAAIKATLGYSDNESVVQQDLQIPALSEDHC